MAHALFTPALTSPALAGTPLTPWWATVPRRDLDALLGAVLAMSASTTGSDQPSGSFSSADDDPADDADADRLKALVELARTGDAEAFGRLYDHYHRTIFRYIYYRVSSRQLAEDLTSDTFVRALGAVGRFQWQGKDFGAWLTTIARNLITDHYKSARSRLEYTTDEVPERQRRATAAEDDAIVGLEHAELYRAMHTLSDDQRDCVAMRFLAGMSIAQVAVALDKSEGAVKQLQLRAMKNLAAALPEDMRS